MNLPIYFGAPLQKPKLEDLSVDNDEALVAGYFRRLSELRSTDRPLTDQLLYLTDVIRNAIRQSQILDAYTGLDGLRAILSDLRPLLDREDKQHQEFLETMMLRKELLEVKLENALLRGDEKLADELRASLRSMEPLFSAAATDTIDRLD